MIECPACFGPGEILGGMGHLVYFTCRDCGTRFYVHEDDINLEEVPFD